MADIAFCLSIFPSFWVLRGQFVIVIAIVIINVKVTFTIGKLFSYKRMKRTQLMD